MSTRLWFGQSLGNPDEQGLREQKTGVVSGAKTAG